MPEKVKLVGCQKDPPDARDRPFSLVNKTLILEANTWTKQHIIQEMTPISDQGPLSSCVGNAATDALEILLGVEQDEVVQLSRLFTYWIARYLTRDTDKDSGTYIRAAMTQLASIGTCPEEDWPYEPRSVYTSPPLRAYSVANSNKISGYYRIEGVGQQRLTEVEVAIRADHPVVFGTAVSSNFLNFTKKGNVLRPPRTQDIIGRHAMILVGIRKSSAGRWEFLLRNSWGTTWGDNGHVWVDESYILWDQTDDLWVPTRLTPIVT